MELDELKQKSNLKVLLRGKSGYGKTYNECKVALRVSGDGCDVLYIDTEAGAPNTMIRMVEDGEFDEDDLENIEHEQCESYDDLISLVERDTQREYDLVVVDTLDDKHTWAMEEVVGKMATGGDDFGIYPQIYDREKKIMESIRRPRTNVLASIDPDSGKMDKPKDCQVNVHGRFTVVVDLSKDGNSYGNVVRNWVANGSAVGKSIPELDEVLADKIMGRVKV